MRFSVNLYSRKTLWKISLLLMAIIISSLSLLITSNLVKKLENEERKKIELAQQKLQLRIIENDGNRLTLVERLHQLSLLY